MGRITRTHVVSLVVVVLVIIGGLLIELHSYLNSSEIGKQGAVTASTSTNPVAVVTVDPKTGKATSAAGYTIEEVNSVPSSIKAPNYKIPLSYGADISSDVKKALEAQYAMDQTLLNKNPTNYDAWVNLGTLHKLTDNYQEAATIWQYVSKIYPTDSVSTDNLGSLYLDFIKDYPKSEAYYNMSISRNPHDVNAYLNLFELYTTYGYKGGMTPEQLVAQGIKANPADPTLLKLQKQLQNQ